MGMQTQERKEGRGEGRRCWILDGDGCWMPDVEYWILDQAGYGVLDAEW
jgi:hypothetical protein